MPEEPVRDEEAGLPPNVHVQPRQRTSIPSFLLIMITLFILTNHNGEEFLARHQYQDGLRSLSWQLSNFTSWLNGTAVNFTIVCACHIACILFLTPIQPERDPTVVPLIDFLLTEGRILNPSKSSYYSNVTGFIHGDSHFFNISPVALPTLNSSLQWKPAAVAFMGANDTNMTDIIDRIGTWNWTASDKVALSVVEKAPNPSVNITDKVALVHVRRLLLRSRVALIMRVFNRGKLNLPTLTSAKISNLNLKASISCPMAPYMALQDPVGKYHSVPILCAFNHLGRRNIDIRMLPSIVPPSLRNVTASIIVPELAARINKLKSMIDAGIIEQDLLSIGL